MSRSTETLVHFQCPACNKWWSIGDADPTRRYYCPWCGAQEQGPHQDGSAPNVVVHDVDVYLFSKDGKEFVLIPADQFRKYIAAQQLIAAGKGTLGAVNIDDERGFMSNKGGSNA